LCIGVEVSGGEDQYVLGVEHRFRETGEEFVRVLGKEGNGEGVDSDLRLVGGEAEGQAGRLAHWEGFVELGEESVEVGCEGSGPGGRIGDQECDRSAVIDLGRDCEGKETVPIPKAASSDVGEAGCDQGRLLVLGRGGTRGVKSSFGRGERLRWLGSRYTVAG